MRVTVVIGLALAASVFAVAATKTRSFTHFVKQRTRPREIRGFKPEYISTAIGFGKRTYQPEEFHDYSNIMETLFQILPRNVPLEVIIREMRVNPAFARKLTRILELAVQEMRRNPGSSRKLTQMLIEQNDEVEEGN